MPSPEEGVVFSAEVPRSRVQELQALTGSPLTLSLLPRAAEYNLFEDWRIWPNVTTVDGMG
jgi:hypothetical protein